jgi:transitional endoplasmic reticulum ATPase
MAIKKAEQVVEKPAKKSLSEEQTFLKKITGKKFPVEEAASLLTEISNHKWYISEKVGRDVGLTVAAVDYLENFTNAGLI